MRSAGAPDLIVLNSKDLAPEVIRGALLTLRKQRKESGPAPTGRVQVGVITHAVARTAANAAAHQQLLIIVNQLRTQGASELPYRLGAGQSMVVDVKAIK
jgi:hypothetical protein